MDYFSQLFKETLTKFICSNIASTSILYKHNRNKRKSVKNHLKHELNDILIENSLILLNIQPFNEFTYDVIQMRTGSTAMYLI